MENKLAIIDYFEENSNDEFLLALKNNFNTYKQQNEIVTNISIELENLTFGKEFSEYIKCIICYNIHKQSNYFTCCDVLACNSCIKEWLKVNKVCPICRSNNFKLNIPNRFVQRMFDDLKFYCAFRNKGCETNNLTFENSLSHTKYCKYNPNGYTKCDKCDASFASKYSHFHDCIKYLNSKVNCLADENQKLKSKQQQQKYKNFDL